MSNKIRNRRCNCYKKNNCQTIEVLVRKFLLMKKDKRKNNRNKHSNKKNFIFILCGILWWILDDLVKDAFRLTDTAKSITETLHSIMVYIGL